MANTSSVPALQWDDGKYEVQKKLGNFVQFFQISLPVNKYGMPLQIINPIPLMDELLEAETTDDISDYTLSLSVMDVELTDGYPALDGVPIWERLDGERIEYYNLFKQYRDMAALNGGARSTAKIGNSHNLLPKYIGALSKVYHWGLRCKAYDAYEKTLKERKRHFEIEQLNSSHSKIAEKLLQQGMDYIDAHPEQLNPKIAIQMIQSGMKAGRLALGLQADKPDDVGGPKTSINISHTTDFSSGEGSSTVEVKQSTKDGADSDYLQSILHVLDQSGAFDQAKEKKAASEIIEGDYEVVDGSADEGA